jgi:hypothetical protein
MKTITLVRPHNISQRTKKIRFISSRYVFYQSNLDKLEKLMYQGSEQIKFYFHLAIKKSETK